MLTTKQVADELGTSTRTINRWRKAGKFMPVSVTPYGHARYSQEQVDKAKRGDYGTNTDMEGLLG